MYGIEIILIYKLTITLLADDFFESFRSIRSNDIFIAFSTSTFKEGSRIS